MGPRQSVESRKSIKQKRKQQEEAKRHQIEDAKNQSISEQLSCLRVGIDEYEQVNQDDHMKIGGMGMVFRVRQKSDGKIFAAKRIIQQVDKDSTDLQKESILREVDIIQKLDHPLVVKFHDWFLDNNNYLYIILHLCEQGSLKDALKERVKYPEEEALRIFTLICISLYYVNSKKIIHRDLKPDNILVDKVGQFTYYKITDFGISY